MSIPNREALNERANNLGTLNGMRLVLVRLDPPANPTAAILTVHFYDHNEIANMLAAAATPAGARQTFPIAGGRRVPAGPLAGQVQTVAVSGNPADAFMELTVRPIGDYSVYTLSLDHPNIDPIFSTLRFKFRPGCFNADCAPDWAPAAPAVSDPAIDYLAKDYDSFRHTLMAAMAERVPGWRATSEADLDQVLIDLLSAAGDELSDMQDRTVQEGYLLSCRSRVSLARHARLMDYHIHQGNQASTWMALDALAASGIVAPGALVVRAIVTDRPEASPVFVNDAQQEVHVLLNGMGLYTWSDAIPSLAKGSTTADLKLTVVGQAAADTVRDLIRTGKIRRLLIQEWLNPTTGQTADRDPNKRQILTLLNGIAGAETLSDPLTSEFFVRVWWRDEDKLAANYCFTVQCDFGKVDNVSRFHGNLVEVLQGAERIEVFETPSDAMTPGAFAYERSEPHGTICRLPPGRLAYRDTPVGGEIPPVSTITLRVQTTSGIDTWEERPDLIHSDDSDEQGDHFVVETDEIGLSVVRLGNGTNGKRLPDKARVLVRYQDAFGPDGNVGADAIREIVGPPPLLAGATCWNPLDVSNGRAPEPLDKILRRVPEMFRFRQLRAVTLADYVRRAEELPMVSRAAAAYGWTGSWRTVRIAIDPKGTTTLDDNMRRTLTRHLDAVRLIGEDIEIRPPHLAPLEIHVSLCVAPDFWSDDLRFVLEQEFSTGFTADGRLAFFHPDNWTFGQTIHVSQILGRLQAIPGVEHVREVRMKRWNSPSGVNNELIQVQTNEIILVNSDPDRMEQGFIDFELRGGRQ